MGRISVRKLTTHQEFDQCVCIQKEVWRHEDIDLTPTHQFCISVRMGAILLGAFAEEEMVGFVYSFPAVFNHKNCQHSHLLAVLPKFQGLGIGKKLKWAQREWAVRRGYDLVTWTFDPLQARNANLNLHTLGATTRTYIPHFYSGTSSLTLGPGITTDRFLMEWPVKTKWAELRRRHRPPREHNPEGLPRALEGKRGRDGFWHPQPVQLSLHDKVLAVETLRDIKSLGKEYALIASWQAAIRRAMRHYFGRNYRAVDFVYDDRCFYILEKKP